MYVYSYQMGPVAPYALDVESGGRKEKKINLSIEKFIAH